MARVRPPARSSSRSTSARRRSGCAGSTSGPARRRSRSSTATRHGPVADGAGHLRWDWARLVAEMDAGWPPAVGAGPGGVDRRRHVGRRLRAARRATASWWRRRSRTGTTAPRATRDVVDRGRRAGGLYATHGRPAPGVQHDLPGGGPRPRRAGPGPPPGAAARAAGPPPHRGGRWPSARARGRPALVDITAGDWSAELAAAAGLDPALLPPIAAAGHARPGRGAASRSTWSAATTPRRPWWPWARPGPQRVRVGGDLAARRPRAAPRPTSARRRGPATSPTRSGPWAASGS